ncbi:MAG: VWA domain-containing protein, partial [Terracidiphilus sp.]
PTQQAILNVAIHFVAVTFQHLPDFLADRVTRSFDDSPNVVTHSGWAPQNSPLHLSGTYMQQVTYRSGREVSLRSPNASGTTVEKGAGPPGMTSTGEFGPILATILRDISKGSIRWSHWEQTAAGPGAVFQYQVPQSASHYQVDYCCVLGADDAKSSAESQDLPIANSYHGTPGYHGEIFLDPARNTIRRITLEAELKQDVPITNAQISVEYGHVNIGGQDYICPTHSIAISNTRVRLGGDMSARTILRINEVSFTDYHRFGTSTRILAEIPTNTTPADKSAPNSDQGKMQSEVTPPAPIASSAESATPTPETPQEPALAESSADAGPDAAQTAKSEVAPEAATLLPPAAATHAAPAAPTAVFKTSARDVVVDVVVRQKNGNPVPGLAKQDFAITEDGVPQSIDFFEEHTAQAQPSAARRQMPPMPAGMRTNVPPAMPGDAVNVLLLDTLNTEPQDESYVHAEIVDFLKKLQPGTEVAIFALDSRLRFVQGFTADPAAMRAALNGKSHAGEPERTAVTRTNSDRAADAETVSTLAAMQMSPAGLAALMAAQNNLSGYQYGQRVTITFEALHELVNYLAGIPGRKNLIWFAGSFPVTVFPTAQQKRMMSQLPGYLDQARQTADLLTVSNISVYPVGAWGITTDSATAADSSMPADNPASGSSRGGGPTSSLSAAASEQASTIASMEQLAADTGGKAFYNTNDLSTAIKKAITDGSTYYTLAYSPTNTRMDGSFRRIRVTLDKGKFKLAYRSGYNAEDASAAFKAEQTNPLEQLMGLGLPSATGLLYGVSAQPAAQQPAPDAPLAGQNWKLKGPVTRYTVAFLIRPEDIAFATGPQGQRTGKLLMEATAYGDDGEPFNWIAATQGLNLDPKTYASMQQSGITARLQIDLPQNTAVHLVTGIYDWNSGLAGTLEAPLHGAPKGTQ